MSRWRHMSAQATLFPQVFTQGAHGTADNTRVTHSRPALAWAAVLIWTLCCVLPASAGAAEIIVRRDPGLSAGQRADVRADAGVKLERTLALPNSELVSVPDARAEAAL